MANFDVTNHSIHICLHRYSANKVRHGILPPYVVGWVLKQQSNIWNNDLSPVANVYNILHLLFNFHCKSCLNEENEIDWARMKLVISDFSRSFEEKRQAVLESPRDDNLSSPRLWNPIYGKLTTIWRDAIELCHNYYNV